LLTTFFACHARIVASLRQIAEQLALAEKQRPILDIKQQQQLLLLLLLRTMSQKGAALLSTSYTCLPVDSTCAQDTGG
jgi:hypothetical protein